MDSHSSPSFKSYLPVCLFMVFAGWGGLAWLIFFTLPAVWQRWGFFLFLTLALTGSALPVTYYLNIRFPSNPRATESIILRQAIWLGIYGSTLAWLQLGGIVTIWTIIGLGFGLIILEYFIRLRERSRWLPPVIDEGTSIQPHG
jgi:hypothetical protein